MICPLSPAHIAAAVAFHLYALLLLVDVRLAPLPLAMFILFCFIAPLFPRLGFYLPIISRGRGAGQDVALTFDDGPDPVVTPRLLDLLAAHSVPATFFVTGMKAERHPEVIREILASGHTIGNHSYSHSPFLMLKGRRILEQEVVSAQQALRRLGIIPLAFRPPVGITGPHLWRILLQQGMHCINFSCRAFDRGNRRITRLAEKMLARVAPGDILLLHDVIPPAGDVDLLMREFDELIGGLKKKGLAVVPLARLIGREVMQTDDLLAEPNPAASFYNDLAATYDHEQFNSGVSLSRKKEYELFSARLPVLFSEADRVLEIGAGTGIFTLDIARRCREVLAVDISRNMLGILEKKADAAGFTNIRPILGDIESCKMEGTFTVVCAISSLAYITDLPTLLRRLSDHVEPGGILYAITARRSLFRFFVQIGNVMRQGLWLKTYSRREISAILQDAGFEPAEITSHLLKSWLSGGIILEVVARRKAWAEAPVAVSGHDRLRSRARAV